jgi:hypothetical protein
MPKRKRGSDPRDCEAYIGHHTDDTSCAARCALDEIYSHLEKSETDPEELKKDLKFLVKLLLTVISLAIPIYLFVLR